MWIASAGWTPDSMWSTSPVSCGRPRYAADHVGAPGSRSPEDEGRWRALLARADVLFDFDYTNDAELPELAPRVRWIQATSAGIGPFVKRRSYDTRMPQTVFTTASGVHARPLAEFCALAMLAFSRGLFVMLDAQRRRHWERFAGTDLLGKTVVIYGHGSIGCGGGARLALVRDAHHRGEALRGGAGQGGAPGRRAPLLPRPARGSPACRLSRPRRSPHSRDGRRDGTRRARAPARAEPSS